MTPFLRGVSFALFAIGFVYGMMGDYPYAAYLMAFACYIRLDVNDAKERAV